PIDRKRKSHVRHAYGRVKRLVTYTCEFCTCQSVSFGCHMIVTLQYEGGYVCQYSTSDDSWRITSVPQRHYKPWLRHTDMPHPNCPLSVNGGQEVPSRRTPSRCYS